VSKYLDCELGRSLGRLVLPAFSVPGGLVRVGIVTYSSNDQSGRAAVKVGGEGRACTLHLDSGGIAVRPCDTPKDTRCAIGHDDVAGGYWLEMYLWWGVGEEGFSLTCNSEMSCDLLKIVRPLPNGGTWGKGLVGFAALIGVDLRGDNQVAEPNVRLQASCYAHEKYGFRAIEI
jgi:hypothetical protein